MKNLINYYYDLILSEMRKNDNNYVFYIDDIEYVFLPFYGNVDRLYEIYRLTYQNGRYVHEIIFNKFKSIITYYNNIPYILLKKNILLKDMVNDDYILKYDFPIYKSINFNWKELWKNKIDYYEYQCKEIGVKYKSITESFSYYIGLSELAISLLNYVNIKEINPYLSHSRIKYSETIDDFCNPVNLVIDSKVRDVSEYLKSNFIFEKISLKESLDIISKLKLNRSEAILLFSRLLYPSYYFDTYDKIIQDKVKSNKLDIYIEKNVYYETFLKQVYSFLKYKYKMPIIEWLEY